VRKIYSRLDAPHPQSISIVGDRRIGKSSLLNYIYLRKNRKKQMQNYANAIFVYLDFQGSADFTIPRFIDFLFNVFRYETGSGSQYVRGTKDLDLLRDAVQELHEKGRRIIVLMDEFESITRNPNFDEGFFSFLRALANNYRVAYVTSSCDELQRMCHNQDISDSPFFNIFSNLPLRPFTHEAALDLIRVPSETEGVPLAAHAERILALAGHFPLYLQIACSCAFEQMIENQETAPDWGRIATAFEDEVAPHYQFVWERMEEPEKENLLRLAQGRKISRRYEFVNENLARRGYLDAGDGGYRIFSDSFARYVARQGRGGKKGSFLRSLLGRGGGTKS
jgi:serine/threonine-protein kinase